MRKVALIFVVLIAFLNANAQKLPSKIEQYDFLKWYIDYKKPENLSDTTNNCYDLKELLNQKRLTKSISDDVLFMKVQINTFSKVTKFDTSLLNYSDWKFNNQMRRLVISHYLYFQKIES